MWPGDGRLLRHLIYLHATILQIAPPTPIHAAPCCDESTGNPNDILHRSSTNSSASEFIQFNGDGETTARTSMSTATGGGGPGVGVHAIQRPEAAEWCHRCNAVVVVVEEAGLGLQLCSDGSSVHRPGGSELPDP
jgi:hypothetical protein